MEKTIHVINGQIVNEGVVQKGHLIIKSGRIQCIASEFPSEQADEVIDAEGSC